MFEVIGLVVGGVAAVAGYMKSRSFVKRRLRYVDSVQKSSVPVLAGAAAAIVAAPIVALLPIIGGPAAIAFGVAVGVGTRAGARDIRDGRE
jgi:inosine-uridine nucleoside N-ribohydrolase